MRAALLALCLTAAPAGAETLMTVAEFEAWSTGKTLVYAVDGVVIGSEQHLPNRQTLDADIGGPCIEGSWFGDGDAVCFIYAAYEGTHCWLFWHDAGVVTAKPLNAGAKSPVYTVTADDAPMDCSPAVGV
ncbi:MAG: hypothetical protein B7Z10_00160 [Rhodobacterales bacterium 32-66-7]|nr:MAG: hypothetical protein B7Z31_03775 [Rhodobacterales bacterium 12-65-15]OYX27524.1 MAG: hypothetical protein B7Z10_00160 [Rhodobacterales bacterium 32-66-7]